jgi:hypothetical protein
MEHDGSTKQVHPRFADPNADIILQSSDGVQFRFYKLLLTMLYATFTNMLSVAQPNHKDYSCSPFKLDVIPLSEDSSQLKLLLICCHLKLNNSQS